MTANATESHQYDIIYADPPWDYGGQTQHAGRGGKTTGGAATHYPTMPLTELKRMSVPAAQNSLLYLWTSSPHLPQARSPWPWPRWPSRTAP